MSDRLLWPLAHPLRLLLPLLAMSAVLLMFARVLLEADVVLFEEE